jgi:hypothetical protein
VKDLDISSKGKLICSILPAMTTLAGETVIETLPALQNIFVHRSLAARYFMQTIESFVAARQLSGRLVAIHFLE